MKSCLKLKHYVLLHRFCSVLITFHSVLFYFTLLYSIQISFICANLFCSICPVPSYLTFTLPSTHQLLPYHTLHYPTLPVDAILHGVETRTSAPVQITRKSDTLECSTLAGLYPTGEGAGYAGGIVVRTHSTYSLPTYLPN